MSFWADFWRSSLRAQLRGVRNWALLLLLPLLNIGLLRLMPAQDVSAPVQVGVVLPETGGEAFWRGLEERSGLAVTFHTATAEQARRQVAAGRWDCALVLPEDFSGRLEAGELDGIAVLYVSQTSAVSALVREPVFASLARLIAPGIAEAYLLEQGIVTESEAAGLRPRLEEEQWAQERVLVELETLDGTELAALELAERGVTRLLVGLTAILLAVWSLFAAMDLGGWLDSPYARRLIPLRGLGALALVRLGAAMLPALLSGGLALLAAECPVWCIWVLVPYLLFWGAAALGMARRRVVWESLPVLMPFVPVLGLLLSPVLTDLSGPFPVLAPVIRWSPVTLCIRACEGRWEDALVLTAAGIVLLVLPRLVPSSAGTRA